MYSTLFDTSFMMVIVKIVNFLTKTRRFYYE